MEWKKCVVVESFVAFIGDMFGNSMSIALNRGKKFSYIIDNGKLILCAKGLKLTIPSTEFYKFKQIEKQ